VGDRKHEKAGNLKEIKSMGKSILARWGTWAFGLLAVGLLPQLARGDGPVVPGTGTKVEQVGDDFEDETWVFNHNLPKSSKNIDQQPRQPVGQSSNARWFESGLRGGPDLVKRVPTPEDGPEGSKGALLMRTLRSGTPNSISGQSQQDDLISAVATRVGQVSVGRTPSVVVRVYLPPFEKWENRTGTSFGFRAETWAKSKPEPSGGLFSPPKKTKGPQEPYWPGMFIQFNSETDGRNKEDSALILIRGGTMGQDILGPAIKETGWWTLGMSFTPDGQVHYYASPGVDDLKPEDHIGSYFPYGFRALRFQSFFFNVSNQDDGQSWSTPWIIDDASVYFLR
jgi:hypothetical protein